MQGQAALHDLRCLGSPTCKLLKHVENNWVRKKIKDVIKINKTKQKINRKKSINESRVSGGNY